MSNKLSKKQRRAAFIALDGGWFTRTTDLEYSIHSNSTKMAIKSFYFLKLTHVDNNGHHALYKCLQFFEQKALDSLSVGGVTHTGLRGVVASYVNEQMKLEFVAMDDKHISSCMEDGKCFYGTSYEFGVNALDPTLRGGGYVAGFSIKKMSTPPKLYEGFDFDKIYKAQHDSVYLNNNNNNNDTNITLESIATESAPNIWVINTDVTISPNQTLVIDQGVTVTTFYNITNSGKFTNEGTFCMAKNNFTNNTNADFNNNGGTTLIYLGGTLKNNGRIDNKSGGKVINLQSTYDGFRVVGNPIVTLTY